MRETTTNLTRIGAMDKQTLKQFKVFTLPPVYNLPSKQIRATHAREDVNEAVSAASLNTTVSTVQKWEIGKRLHSGPPLKLADSMMRNGVRAF